MLERFPEPILLFLGEKEITRLRCVCHYYDGWIRSGGTGEATRGCDRIPLGRWWSMCPCPRLPDRTVSIAGEGPRMHRSRSCVILYLRNLPRLTFDNPRAHPRCDYCLNTPDRSAHLAPRLHRRCIDPWSRIAIAMDSHTLRERPCCPYRIPGSSCFKICIACGNAQAVRSLHSLNY